MNLLTEQLRNGRIEVESAILQAADLCRGTPAEPFFRVLADKMDNAAEKQIELMRVEHTKELNDMKDAHGIELKIQYNEGWNACVSEIETNIPNTK